MSAPITFVPVVKMMPVGDLIPAPFNPGRRTSNGKPLDALIEDIVEAGGIVQPLIVSNDKRIIDGHRRYRAAQVIGYAEVPCIISPLSLQVGWRVLNRATMTVAPKDWLAAHVTGLTLENLPTRQQLLIKRLLAVVGNDGLIALAEAGMAPNVYVEAQRCARYIEFGDARERAGTPGDEMTRKVIFWMAEFRQQTDTRKAIENGMSPSLLRYTVENGLVLKSEHRP